MKIPILYGSDEIQSKIDAAPAATRAGVRIKNYRPNSIPKRNDPLSHHSVPVITSEVTAQVADVSVSIRARILDVLHSEGEHGLTDDEGEIYLDIKSQSYTPSRRGLVKSEHVVDSGRKRDTSRGRPAAVWVLTRYKREANGGAE
jgi:hypothetical protein